MVVWCAISALYSRIRCGKGGVDSRIQTRTSLRATLWLVGRNIQDIRFSNSPVEAVNLTVKKYLRHHKPRSEPELKRVIQFVVQDYNSICPHVSLNGLMPMEAYTDSQKVLGFSRQKRNAKVLRLAQNQKTPVKHADERENLCKFSYLSFSCFLFSTCKIFISNTERL